MSSATNLLRRDTSAHVDGPPSSTQRLARYPVLPVLAEHLSDECALLMDDAARPDERAMVARWLREYPGFALETLPAEKGAALLYRSGTPTPADEPARERKHRSVPESAKVASQDAP